MFWFIRFASEGEDKCSLQFWYQLVNSWATLIINVTESYADKRREGETAVYLFPLKVKTSLQFDSGEFTQVGQVRWDRWVHSLVDCVSVFFSYKSSFSRNLFVMEVSWKLVKGEVRQQLMHQGHQKVKQYTNTDQRWEVTKYKYFVPVLK